MYKEFLQINKKIWTINKRVYPNEKKCVKVPNLTSNQGDAIKIMTFHHLSTESLKLMYWQGKGYQEYSMLVGLEICTTLEN